MDQPLPPSPPPPPLPPGAVVAPVPRRLAAYLADVLIAVALVAAIHWGLLARLFESGRPPAIAAGVPLWLWVLLTVSLPVHLYFALQESGRRGQTLGKRWLRLRVAGENGARIGLPRALVRSVAKLLPWEVAHAAVMLPVPLWDAGRNAALRPGFMVSTLLFGAWLATVLLTPRSQGAHDLIAATLVFDSPPPAATP